jgi:hypothetical protein
MLRCISIDGRCGEIAAPLYLVGEVWAGGDTAFGRHASWDILKPSGGTSVAWGAWKPGCGSFCGFIVR